MSVSDFGKVRPSLQVSNVEVQGHGSASTSGSVIATGQISGTFVPSLTVTALSDALATLTAAQLLGGLISIPASADRALTTPTAALLKAAIPRCKVGSTLAFVVQNTGASTATMTAGTNVTIIDTNNTSKQVAANTSAKFGLYCTDAGTTPTFSLYRLN